MGVGDKSMPVLGMKGVVCAMGDGKGLVVIREFVSRCGSHCVCVCGGV